MNRAFFIWISLMTAMLLLPPSGHCQGEAPVEKLKIIFDRDLYLDGDTLWLKFINSNRSSGSIKHLSSTVYVEMMGPGNQLITRAKIGMTAASGYGWLKIPEGLYSGYYYLRAYTSWMKAGPLHDYSYAMIAVVNPKLPLYDGQQHSEPEDSAREVHSVRKVPDLSVQIDSEKKIYRRREKAKFSMQISDGEGRGLRSHCSVSVCLTGVQADQDIWKALSLTEVDHTLRPVMDESPANAPVVPELYGPAVTGIIMDRKKNVPVDQTLVSCTSLGSASQFQVFRTGTDGRFRFIPQTDQEYSDLVFSLAAGDSTMAISIDDPFVALTLDFSVPRLHLDKNHLPYIEQLSINRQVTKAFMDEPARVRENTVQKLLAFYGDPAETIELDEFIKLPVMEEVFRELVRTVIVYRSGGEFKLGVLDADTKEIIGDRPLFLLDGVPIYEPASILKIAPGLLASIHVLNSKYFIGELEVDGIIDIRSRKGKFESFEYPVNTITYRFQSCRQAFNGPGQELSPGHTITGSHQPDFRTLLYWDPEIITDENGNAEFSFSTSDVPGQYSIVVEGVGQDGRMGSKALEVIVL